MKINTSDIKCDPVYFETRTYKPNDGFILEESAMTGPGANLRSQFMPGSNHLQMRNDRNMEQAKDFILTGGLHNYFRSL